MSPGGESRSGAWPASSPIRGPTTGCHTRSPAPCSGVGLLVLQVDRQHPDGQGAASRRNRRDRGHRVHRRPGAARFAPAGGRSARGRLDGVGEDGCRLDAPTRPHRPRDQATQRAHPAGQDRAEVPRPAQPRLHRRRAELQMGWRHSRDPHRGRQAVPGHGDLPVFPVGCSARPPACTRTRSWRARRSRWPWWPAAAPNTSPGSSSTPTGAQDLHRRQVHRPAPATGHSAVHEPGRLLLRQRRSRGALPQPRVEVLARHDFATTRAAQAVAMDWCYGFYNRRRRHSAAAGLSPINYETAALNRAAA